MLRTIRVGKRTLNSCSRTHSSRRHSSWHVPSRFQRSSSSFCLCECHFLRWSSVRDLRRRLGSASNNDPRLLFLAVQARRPSPPRGAHRSGHTDALALSAAQQIPVPSTGHTYWCPGGLLSDRPASCLSRPSVGGTSTDAGFGLIRSRPEYCGLVSQGNAQLAIPRPNADGGTLRSCSACAIGSFLKGTRFTALRQNFTVLDARILPKYFRGDHRPNSGAPENPGRISH